MALNPSNSRNFEHLALKGLTWSRNLISSVSWIKWVCLTVTFNFFVSEITYKLLSRMLNLLELTGELFSYFFSILTLSSPVLSNGYTSKCSAAY